MKLYMFSILTLFLSGFVSCQSKPIQTIFETSVEDTATKLKEIKIYKLKKQTINSDFDYSKLDDIDGSYGRFHKSKKIITAFEPISGQYNYYQFISTFKGQSYNDGGPTLIKDFHDILIVKTDSKNQIVDAYQYTLEWSEPPFQYDVYKSKAENLTLTNSLQLTALKLTRTYSWNEKDKIINEEGIILLKQKNDR